MAGEAEEDAFLRWAAEIGVSDSPSSVTPSQPSSSSSSSSCCCCLGQSLLLSHFPDAGGRGLAAARELRRGERVLRVPRAVLVTRESVLSKDVRLAACVKRHPYLSSTQILAVCLLAEVGKGSDSMWCFYLRQLPRSYSTLASFSQFEINSLQVNDAVWVSEKAVLKAQSDWKEAVNLMKDIGLGPQFLTFRSWLWASATISSRALHVPWDDAGCLCPVGDFFNYAAPEDEQDVEAEAPPSLVGSLRDDGDTDTKTEQISSHSRRLTDGGYDEDVASYCFYARKRYQKGEQVLLGYGTYTNLELLEHYGFLLNMNPNDKAFLQLDADIHSSHSWPKDSLYIQQDGRPSFALLSTLRLWATPQNLRRVVGHLAYSGSQLSVENEISIMKWVAKKCHSVLGKMPSSVEDDRSLLDIIDKMLKHPSYKECRDWLTCEGELREFFQVNALHKGVAESSFRMRTMRSMERWRLAVQWRFCHKKVLLDCISYCNKVIDTLLSQPASSKQDKSDLIL